MLPLLLATLHVFRAPAAFALAPSPGNSDADVNKASPASPVEDAGNAGNALQAWKSWKSRHQKVYSSQQEEAKRLHTFQDNMARAEQLSEQAAASSSPSSASFGGLGNPFMDTDYAEFRRTHSSARGDKREGGSLPQLPSLLQGSAAAAATTPTIDWVKKGAVTSVKDQGQCGSCWAFSTTGNVEGQHFLNGSKHELVSLSEQMLVDCDTKSGDQGCQGGRQERAYQYIISNKGIDTEASYPYTGRQAQCKLSSGKIGATISNWTSVDKDEDEMAAQLVAVGPLAIGINSGNMMLYAGGVDCPPASMCDPTALDHGMLIVGWGMEGKQAYWKIKNSWGLAWGENGYYRICKGRGACGLNQDVTTSLIF